MMKKLAISLVLLFTVTAVVLFQSCQSTKSSTASKMLKFNLENGKGYDYEMTMNMDQEIQGKKIQLDMSAYYSMDVKGSEGENKDIIASIDRFKVKTAVEGFNFEIDTDKPLPADTGSMEKNPMGMVNKIFNAIKGQRFMMKVNAEGKVIQVTGFENMANNLLDSMGVAGEEKAQLIQQFNQQFNGEQMQGQLDRFWYIFPNKEVKVGDSWEKSTNQTGQMPGTYNSKYTVSEIEGDMVTLDEDTKVTVQEQNVKLDGKITGKIVVDSRIGLVIKADQDMKMTASGEGQKFDIKGKMVLRGKAR